MHDTNTTKVLIRLTEMAVCIVSQTGSHLTYNLTPPSASFSVCIAFTRSLPTLKLTLASEFCRSVDKKSSKG